MSNAIYIATIGGARYFVSLEDRWWRWGSRKYNAYLIYVSAGSKDVRHTLLGPVRDVQDARGLALEFLNAALELRNRCSNE